MEILENKQISRKSHASSVASEQNIAGTGGEIDTRLTQPRSANVHSRVYFIEGGDFIKIGVSANPIDRLAALQTSTPFDLKLLADFPGDASEEFRIQGAFAHLHVRGEWFRRHPAILDYVESRKRKKGVRQRKRHQNLNGRDWIWL
jgi:hypothetical protein